ncbi:MAG: hypothetical protein H6558_08895 [Lewinellaceae bacterium]|nr:hypothetical protein [Lewinellaceae bacterium]
MAATALMTADAIIFTINSAIKLSHNIRRAYAQSLRGKKLVLPLPEFTTEIKFNTLLDFFEDHPEYTQRVERLAQLHKEADENLRLPEEKHKEYLEYYRAFHTLHLGRDKRPDMNADDMVNLFRIRQWEKGTQPNTVLQLVAGTIVELGIDYFLQTPGALNSESARGRAIRHFLVAFDEIDFSQSKDIKLEISNKLVPRLFAAAAESLAELSPEIVDDEKLQLFIKETTKGIANTLYEKSKGLSGKKQREAAYWGQMVLRSMINNAGAFVFSSPETLFDVNKPVSMIIQSTGLTLLDAILDDDEENKIKWQNAITADTLDDIARSTLKIVAEHPNVIGGNRGVQKIISEVALAVRDEDFRRQGLIPEIARIVLEKSAGNLELLWRVPPPTGPDGAKPPEHLLVVAVQQLLGILSEKHGDAPWRPALTKAHLLGLAYDLLDEVVQNPSWVTSKVNQDSVLAEVLDITFQSLSLIPKERRLNAETIRWLIRLNMKTALTSKKVLDEVPWGGPNEKTVVLEKALDLVFTCVFPQDAPTDVSRMELLAELTEYILDAVISRHPGRQGLVLTGLILFESGIDYSEGFDRELADELLDAAFEAIANRPELLTREKGLKHILGEIAAAISSAQLKQPGLLPFLAQLVLEKTGQNAHLIIDADTDKPRHLLTTALKHILSALSNKDSQGNWRPEVSIVQAQALTEMLLEETVVHPFWITEKVNQDSLLAEVLDTTFTALAQAPRQERLAPDTLEMLIQLNLQTVAASPIVLKKVAFADDQEEKAILQRALELVFSFVFPEEGTTDVVRISLLTDLLEYILSVIMARHPNKRGLILANLVLFENNGIDYSIGFNEALANQLVDSALIVLSQHPELAARGEVLQQIIGDVATTLTDSEINRPEMLPELIRLTLHYTGMYLDQVFNLEEKAPEHLLVLATREVLKAIAEKPRSGKWKPRLSNEQVMEILEIVFDAVTEYPQWIQAEEVIYLILEAIFRALEAVDSAHRLPYIVFKRMVESVLEAAYRQRQFIVKIQTREGAHYQIMLRYSLESLFILIYDENDDEETIWRLSQAEIITGIIDYYLLILTETPGSVEDVDKAVGHIREVITQWKKDLSRMLEEVLEELNTEIS